ncbi:MAG TPA: hypothetical protein VK660_10625, partial [Xanthomonadaceae bacterium]|nr:hypothetical protein [Xanthomonadaceae bacterium]
LTVCESQYRSGIDAFGLTHRQDPLAGQVVPQQASKGCVCAKRGDLTGNIRSATKAVLDLANSQDGDRRFRRNAFRGTHDILIQHDVAHNPDLAIADAPKYVHQR